VALLAIKWSNMTDFKWQSGNLQNCCWGGQRETVITERERERGREERKGREGRRGGVQ